MMIAHPNRSKSRKVAASSTPSTYDHERDYTLFRESVATSFAAGSGPLFETDAVGLNDAYMAALPSDHAVHACTACRRFLDTFGGLVRVADDNSTVPAMWSAPDVPEFYVPVVEALRRKLRGARIVRPFLSAQAVLGLPKTGEWEHFAVKTCPVFRHALLTPNQASAAKKEDFRTVSAALAEFKAPMLDEALRLLESEHLHRSERFVAPVKWLRDLHDRPKGRAGENLLWRAIATAPDGFCHPRASVVGSLLEDLAAGMSFDQVKSRFDAKVAPLAYQRPQAAPAAGAIKAAEAMFEKMGLAPSLLRRFARLEDCETIWKHMVAGTPHTAGVFGHLKPKSAESPKPLDVPGVTMTWEKFARTVLPKATALDLLVPSHGSFIALTSAVNADAPPLLKWNNPVAWYVYPGGSPASRWRLTPGWRKVTAAVPLPTMWGDNPQPHLGEGIILTLDGAVDEYDAGNALFPECLRAEMHQVRSVIELYSCGAKLYEREKASACGYDIRKSQASCTLRAFDGKAWSIYKIDRWD